MIVLAFFGCSGTTSGVVTTFKCSGFLVDVVDVSYSPGPLEIKRESVVLKIRGEDSEIPLRVSRYSGFEPDSKTRKIYGTLPPQNAKRVKSVINLYLGNLSPELKEKMVKGLKENILAKGPDNLRLVLSKTTVFKKLGTLSDIAPFVIWNTSTGKDLKFASKETGEFIRITPGGVFFFHGNDPDIVSEKNRFKVGRFELDEKGNPIKFYLSIKPRPSTKVSPAMKPKAKNLEDYVFEGKNITKYFDLPIVPFG